MQFRKQILLIIILFSCISVHAQWRKRKQIQYSGFFDSYFWRGPFNYYVSLGTSAYYGDLTSQLKYNNFKPSIGIGANYNMWARVLLGAEVNYFGLGSDDEIPERNLAFKSKNLEFSAYGRFEIIYNRILKHSERKKKPKLVKPYIHLGISFLRYWSETYSLGGGSGDTLAEEPLGYPRWTFTVPTGLGVKFSFSNRVAVSTQLNYRLTFTDYLDKVSELRGNPDKNDAYVSANIMFEYTPGAKRKHPKKPHPKERIESGSGSGADSTKKDDRWQSAPDEKESPDNNTPNERITPEDNPDESTEDIPEEEIEEDNLIPDEENKEDSEDSDENSDEEWDESDDSEWEDDSNDSNDGDDSDEGDWGDDGW